MTRVLPDYQVSGDGDATVFLIHGLLGSKDYWRFHTARLLDLGFRVVAVDLPGYGLSPLPADFSFPVMAEMCANLVKKVGSATNIVHGHSMGGQLTPQIFAKAPQHIHGIVIGSTIGYLGNKTPEEREQFIRERQSTVDQPDPAAAIPKLIANLMAPGSSGPEVDLVNSVALTTAPETFRAAIKAVQGNADDVAVAAIRSVTVPALLLAGELDATGKPDGMRRIADMIAGAEFAVNDGVGHYGWAENPDAYNSVLHPFLLRVAGR